MNEPRIAPFACQVCPTGLEVRRFHARAHTRRHAQCVCRPGRHDPRAEALTSAFRLKPGATGCDKGMGALGGDFGAGFDTRRTETRRCSADAPTGTLVRACAQSQAVAGRRMVLTGGMPLCVCVCV